MMRLLRVVLAFIAVGAAAPAAHAANCTMPATCSATPFLNNPSCCFGLYCQLDGDVTLSAADCTLDFGNRDVTISGKIQLGTRRLHVRAKSVVISNAVEGKGGPASRGGTLEVETFVGTALDFRLQTNAAKIDLSGGAGGGRFLLAAKGGVSLEQGEIRADGSSAAAEGGSIDISSDAGNIQANVLLSASDGSSTGGGSSRVRLLAPGGGVTVNGANILATAGSIDIAARDAVASDQGAKLRADRGGSVDVVGGVLALAGEISAAFGSIALHATSGALAVTRTSQPGLRVDASSEGDTGEIDLVADAPGPIGTITVATPVVAPGADVSARASGKVRVTKKLSVSGVSAAGDTTGAGAVSLESELLDVEVADEIVANDSQSEGSIDVTAAHDVVLTANLETKGSMGGPGGTVTIIAGRDVTLASGRTIDASGGESGGAVEVRASRNLSLATTSTIDVGTGQPGPGGAIELLAGADGETGALTIAGRVLANTQNAAVASLIVLGGCTVAIPASGTVDSNRSGGAGLSGTNEVTARQSISVAGKLLGNGGNLLTTTTPPGGGGQVNPAFTVSLRHVCTDFGVPAGCLLPCPTCGDGTVSFPETCDDAAPDRCSGDRCTPTCRVDSVCSAALPCAGVACDPVGGCYLGPEPAGTECDDGNACTPTDTCSAGTCVGSGAVTCSDGNVCNGIETCVAPGGCQAGTPLVCNDGEPCTTDSCAPGTGCQFVANALPCDDGNECTVDDTCGNSACQSGTPRTCAPGEVCDPSAGCEPAPSCTESADCDDGNACNGTETCVNDACVPGTPVTCSDGNVCNGLETCIPATGACQPGVPCDDGNACNGTETCTQQAGCQAGTPPACADSDVCTTDSCSPTLGCQHAPVPGCCNTPADCTDDDVCTDAACVANACEFTTSALCCQLGGDCVDGNACTVDGVCNGANRCDYAPLSGPQPGCGDACIPASCDAGVCEPAEPTACDDGLVCTDDTCDPVAGCVFTPVPDCCETSDDCADADPCTVDTCDTGLHTCSHVPDETCAACTTDMDCDPLGRCGGTACEGGVCVAVTPLACDDGNVCTVDSCPDAGGCRHALVTCDDRLACNGPESCSPIDGCRAGAVPNCDDGDRCTDDACEEPSGCVHVQRTGFPGVTCQLDGVSAILDAAGPEDVTVKLRRKLGKLLTRVRATLRNAAAATKASKRARLTARAAKQLRGLAKVIDKGRDRGIVPELADTLRRAIDGATGAVGAVDGAG